MLIWPKKAEHYQTKIYYHIRMIEEVVFGAIKIEKQISPLYNS